MNKEQRNRWDAWIDGILKEKNNALGNGLLVEVNRYILKLERELQNIKGSKKIAAILKVQGK